MEEWRRTTYDVSCCKAHAGADLLAVIENGAMREAGGFRSRGCTRRELDVNNVSIGEVLGGKCAGRRTVEKVRKGGSTSEGVGINATRGVVDEDQVLETRDAGRLEILAGQIRYQLFKQWNIGTGCFEW